MYAARQVNNPLSKSEYERGINDKKSNAYLVAMADFMNAPEVETIDIRDYAGKKGDAIMICASDDFMVTNVTVAIISKAGLLLEEGQAMPEVPGTDYFWKYKGQSPHRNLPGTIIRATAYDRPGNSQTREVILGAGSFGLTLADAGTASAGPSPYASQMPPKGEGSKRSKAVIPKKPAP